MQVVEKLKRRIGRLTARGRPSREELREAVHTRKTRLFMLADDGIIPNNATLPLVLYGNAVNHKGAADQAAAFKALFERNGWGDSWRDGIYDYAHYHSNKHEVLGIARGRVRVRFGGDHGREIELKVGDVAILPAGTGHQCLKASKDLLVVGAYPPEGEYDECRATPADREQALKRIAATPKPKSDPVYGKDGPLTTAWPA
jgi:uncharacterized protein YjlB